MRNLGKVSVHNDGNNSLGNRSYHIHVAFRVKDCSLVGEHRELGHVEPTSVVVRADDTGRIEEAHNDQTAEAPAGEANSEADQIFDGTLLGRIIGVWQVSDWVNAGFTLELLPQVFSVVLNHIVIPQDVESATMSSPADQENSAPERHKDGEDASER